jgi:HEAT repeat protein
VVDKRRIPTGDLCSPDEETRRLAVVGLSAYALAEAKEFLFRAMGDASWRVRKEAVETISAGVPSAETIEELIDLLRSPDNAGLRNSAVEVLVRLGTQAGPALQLRANDPDHDVRKFIIDIMGSIGDASFVPLLIRALDDPDANVRAAAVENLGKIGDSRALQPLVNVLEKSDVCLQYTILEALAGIGDPVPMPVIAPLAAVAFLKKAVYDCLGTLGGADAVPILLEGLRDKGKKPREAAVRALEKVRDRLPPGLVDQIVDAGLRGYKASPVVEAMRESLDTPDIQVRKAFIKILGIIGDERVLPDMLRGCRDDRLRGCSLQALEAMNGAVASFLTNAFPGADAEERCNIVYLCGEMGFAECAPLLVEGMDDPLPAVRKASVLACGRLARADLIPGIAKLLRDFNPDVRGGVIGTLVGFAEVAGEMVAQIAASLVPAGDPEQRCYAALLFGALGDAEQLSLLMKDEDVSVRKTAVVALAGLKRKECAGNLLMALVDENPEVRIAAASALDEAAGMNALKPLLLLLNDVDPRVQCVALKSLGRLKEEQAVHAVETMLDRATGTVMIAALEALGMIGGDKSAALLEKALGNDDEEVVKTAMECLAGGGNEWVAKHLDELLYHSHWGVRICFVRILADFWRGRAVPYLRQALAAENDDLVRARIMEAIGRCR